MQKLSCLHLTSRAASIVATEDSESHTLLGYYRDSSDTKPGWRKLKVDLKAEHLEVRARSGFYVSKPAKSPDDARKLEMEPGHRLAAGVHRRPCGVAV